MIYHILTEHLGMPYELAPLERQAYVYEGVWERDIRSPGEALVDKFFGWVMRLLRPHLAYFYVESDQRLGWTKLGRWEQYRLLSFINERRIREERARKKAEAEAQRKQQMRRHGRFR